MIRKRPSDYRMSMGEMRERSEEINRQWALDAAEEKVKNVQDVAEEIKMLLLALCEDSREIKEKLRKQKARIEELEERLEEE